MTLSTFAPSGARFYDARTITALVTRQLNRIWADENNGRITPAQAIERAQAVHAVAMECRADAGLVGRCGNPACNMPLELAWRMGPPYSDTPYCSALCTMEHCEADPAASRIATGPNSAALRHLSHDLAGFRANGDLIRARDAAERAS